MSMCDESAAVVALVSPERAATRRGSHSVTSVPSGCRVSSRSASEGHHQVPADVPSWATTALYLLPLQLLALERALHKGLDPDKPRHLTAVIHLDESPDPS